MELSTYLAEGNDVGPDGDPGPTWTTTLDTDDGPVHVTTDVGLTFEAWALVYQEFDFMGNYFDGNLYEADDEEIEDTDNWGPVDEAYVEHVRDTIVSNVDPSTPMAVIESMTAQDLVTLHGRIVNHAIARVGV